MRILLRIVPSLLMLVLLATTLVSVPVNAQTAVILRLGIVPDDDPTGPLFVGPFTRRTASAIINGFTGESRSVVIEVTDPAPVTGATDGIDTVQVNVSSDSDSNGISGLVLRETSNASGVFRGTFLLSEGATSPSSHVGTKNPSSVSRPSLKVKRGDTVTVVYRNRTAQTLVDTIQPRVTNLEPVHNSFLPKSIITVSARVTDDISGVDEDDIFFLVSSKQFPDTDIFVKSPQEPKPLNDVLKLGQIHVEFPSSSRVVKGSGGSEIGWEVSARVPVNISGGFGETFVTVAALDKAGNLAIIDADQLKKDVTFAKYTVDTQPPELFLVRTGVDYDSRAKQLKANRRNKLQLIFRDRTDLDPKSIHAADFRVEGHTVTKADWFDAGPLATDVDGTQLADGDPKSFVRRMVFLTLASELRSDERPGVSVVPNGIMDKAGNVLASASVTGRDAIGAKLSIESITPLLAGRETKVEIVINAEENLARGGSVSVRVTNVANLAGSVIASTRSIDASRWRAIITPPTRTGIYNIYVTSKDRNGNVASAGLEPVDILPLGAPDGFIDNFFRDNRDAINTDAIYFEGDRNLPAPNIIPRDGNEIAQRGTIFITLDFGTPAPGENLHEGNEYKGDSHKQVALTKATLDGVDILARASSTDKVKWLITLNSLSLGSHTLVINARDEAGNELSRELSTRFKVVPSSSITLSLEPGWNLVGFPLPLANPSVDAVIRADTPVSLVQSFDPTVPGGWRVAARQRASNGTFGPFIGDLRVIDVNQGYWMLNDSSSRVLIDLFTLPPSPAGVAQPTTPVAISIFEGWNLIAVRVPGGNLGMGDVIDSDVYFASIKDKISRIYTFDSNTNRWQQVVLDGRLERGTQRQLTGSGSAGACSTCPLASNERITVGKAYWVFANDSGTLIP